MKVVTRLAACVFLLSLCLVSTAWAANWPDRPITLIVNYGGGGGTDTSARILAKGAEKHLGVPIAVVNKTGGFGTTGLIELMTKKADGRTIGVGTYAPLTIMPYMMKLPFTPANFDYIMSYGIYGYGIAVKADSPIKTAADIAKAYKEKGSLSYSASGYPQPFAMLKIAEVAGIKFEHIPVKSSTEAYTTLLGGHVDMTCIVLGDILPLVKSGEVRLIGVCSPERLAITPDVPTMREQGFDATLNSRLTICAPKGVPADRLKILRDAFAQAFKDPEFQDVMSKLNMPAVYATGEDTWTDINAVFAETEKNLKAMGVLDQQKK